MSFIQWTIRLGFIALLGWLLWLLWQSQFNPTPNPSINTVSRVEATPSAAAEESKPPPKSQMLRLQLPDWEAADDARLKPAAERPYLQVYREWQQALQCEPYYHREHEHQGLLPIEDYMSLRLGRAIEDIEPWNVNQISHFMDFLHRCEQLKKATFQRVGIQQRYPEYVGYGPYVYPAVNALVKELNRTPAMTPAEQSLKATLALKKQWLAVAAELLEVSKGLVLLDEEQIAVLQQEIEELSVQLHGLDPTMDSEQLMEQQHDLLSQIIQRQRQIDQRGTVDTELRDAMVKQLLEMDTQLRQLLHSPHVDTMIEASEALEFTADIDWRVSSPKVPQQYDGATAFLPEYITPSDVMFEMSGVKDRQFYDTLIRSAAQWWLCERGHDCSPESDWVLSYCLGQAGQHHHPAACGLNLPEFFKSHYWTPQQWAEIQPLKPMMEAYHAE